MVELIYILYIFIFIGFIFFNLKTYKDAYKKGQQDTLEIIKYTLCNSGENVILQDKIGPFKPDLRPEFVSQEWLHAQGLTQEEGEKWE